MMGDVVNLRTARKRARRLDGEKAAAAQRVRHGTPKALRQKASAQRDKAVRDLEAHRLDKDGK